ncbi:MAG: FAD-binding oxidoreductase [Anaerolineales bacterium]|nr:FAD-binding oxidoreductase [Anaerolineales bacterium]MCW5855626.1 FAD-binding oxidoreductase [Anaerolineales bacterium]
MSPDPSLSLQSLSGLENFGHSLRSSAWLYQPEQAGELPALFKLARQQGLSIALRGSGRSYGDAALNSGQIVLDLRRLNRVLAWDPARGRITVEPGVTIEDLWNYVLADGWWPPVVPGTMFPTIGGCLSANIHGKNNWVAGPIGEHVLEFSALLPNGRRVTCTPRKNGGLFRAMIGGLGMLGVFTSITLQLKPIESGRLEVNAWAEPNLDAMLAAIDTHKDRDYVVGWVDCTAGGRVLGRGQIHTARYLHAAEDPQAEASLRVDAQVLPARMFGLVPRGWLPKLMAPFMNNLSVWAVNTAKYLASRTISHHKTYRQSLIEFNFLLDYIPGWERSYGRDGLIQYQSFIPKARAADAFAEILRLCQKAGLPSYLGVLKRHRPDPFLLTHALDGYSLALDFKVTPANRARLSALAVELDEVVLGAGGRLYFVKDSTLRAGSAKRFLGRRAVAEFKKLKTKTDPHNLLQSDLYRRWFD